MQVQTTTDHEATARTRVGRFKVRVSRITGPAVKSVPLDSFRGLSASEFTHPFHWEQIYDQDGAVLDEVEEGCLYLVVNVDIQAPLVMFWMGEITGWADKKANVVTSLTQIKWVDQEVHRVVSEATHWQLDGFTPIQGTMIRRKDRDGGR